MVQRTGTLSRDERAERRASIHDAVAEAAHVSAATDPVHAAAKQAQQAMSSYTSGSTNVRARTGHTPRVGSGNDDVVYSGVPGTSGGGQQAPSAPNQALAPAQAVNTGGNGNDNGDDGAGNDDGGDGRQDQGGDGGGDHGQAAPVPVGDGGAGQAAPAGQAAAVPPVPPAPLAPVPQLVYAVPPTPTWSYPPPTREKKLRLPKFRGLGEPKVSVKAWLKAVKNELRRQTAILRTEWREHEVFIEMVGSFEGEALMWYDTVEDSFSRRDERSELYRRHLEKNCKPVTRLKPGRLGEMRNSDGWMHR
ncbi:hypothetical protein DVH05_016310 [Phytophthora capsici]|nr:hypothetical protein DVH05_016310 [Phytophthora capsici]